MTASAPEILVRLKDVVEPALRSAIDGLADERMRLIAGYQLGWNDASGHRSDAGGKAIRPALAVLSAQAVTGGDPAPGIAPAVAVELVHNFSLLHDDVMDRDVERRHRPTGWVAFGEGQAILAGNAMLARAVEVIMATDRCDRVLPALLDSTQALISGQSRDLDLEGRKTVTLDEVLDMEGGKTAALLACSSSIGALAAGAEDHVVKALWTFGYELGIAFQIIDDVLGVVGDPAKTGKSSSADVRAGKRSSVVVAALTSGTDAGARLGELLAEGAPQDEAAVHLATSLIVDSGALDWANREADARLANGLGQFDGLGLADPAASELVTVGTYIVTRDR